MSLSQYGTPWTTNTAEGVRGRLNRMWSKWSSSDCEWAAMERLAGRNDDEYDEADDYEPEADEADDYD